MNDHLPNSPREPMSDEDLLALLAEAYPSPKTDIAAAVRARMTAETLAPIPGAKRSRAAVFGKIAKWGSLAACLLIVGAVGIKVLPLMQNAEKSADAVPAEDAVMLENIADPAAAEECAEDFAAEDFAVGEFAAEDYGTGADTAGGGDLFKTSLAAAPADAPEGENATGALLLDGIAEEQAAPENAQNGAAAPQDKPLETEAAGAAPYAPDPNDAVFAEEEPVGLPADEADAEIGAVTAETPAPDMPAAEDNGAGNLYVPELPREADERTRSGTLGETRTPTTTEELPFVSENRAENAAEAEPEPAAEIIAAAPEAEAVPEAAAQEVDAAAAEGEDKLKSIAVKPRSADPAQPPLAEGLTFVPADGDVLTAGMTSECAGADDREAALKAALIAEVGEEAYRAWFAETYGAGADGEEPNADLWTVAEFAEAFGISPERLEELRAGIA